MTSTTKKEFIELIENSAASLRTGSFAMFDAGGAKFFFNRNYGEVEIPTGSDSYMAAILYNATNEEKENPELPYGKGHESDLVYGRKIENLIEIAYVLENERVKHPDTVAQIDSKEWNQILVQMANDFEDLHKGTDWDTYSMDYTEAIGMYAKNKIENKIGDAKNA